MEAAHAEEALHFTAVKQEGQPSLFAADQQTRESVLHSVQTPSYSNQPSVMSQRAPIIVDHCGSSFMLLNNAISYFISEFSAAFFTSV